MYMQLLHMYANCLGKPTMAIYLWLSWLGGAWMKIEGTAYLYSQTHKVTRNYMYMYMNGFIYSQPRTDLHTLVREKNVRGLRNVMCVVLAKIAFEQN